MKIRKLFLPAIFLLILFLPFLLQQAEKLYDIKADLTLQGNFEEYEKPEFVVDDFLEGEFQKKYEEWMVHNTLPCNTFIKSYNQMQYSLFHLNNDVVGKNHNFYEYKYIMAELSLNGEDYSLPSKFRNMQDYVECLERVKAKLEKVDKHLVIILTPSKAHWMQEDIPYRFMVQKQEGAVRAVDCLRGLLRETDITCIDTEKSMKECTLPIYYKTGTHWSRPVEQMASVQIIEELNQAFDKKYRQIGLGKLNSQSTPYWRDADLYLLSNLLLPTEECIYYEYEIQRQHPEEYDKLRLLLQGCSYGEGFYYDHFDTYPGDEAYFVFYDRAVTYDNGEVHVLKKWEDLDLQYLLDQTDIVAIELNESMISELSFGFTQQLSAFLDTYVPGEREIPPADSNLMPAEKTGLAVAEGFYDYETAGVWTGQYANITLHNENISNRGLRLSFLVHEYALQSGNLTIRVLINGHKVREYTVAQSGVLDLIIPAEDFMARADHVYEIELICDNTFNQKAMGVGEDLRDLALYMFYLGEVQEDGI